MAASPPVPICVLLVEDDDGDALLVEEQLDQASSGIVVVRGRTLREALAELPGRIDCVLLDLGLPDGLGVESVRRLRTAAPGIAVIVLTGLDNEAAGEEAVDAGAQDYLIKGRVDGSLLTRAIRYAVARHNADDVQRQLHLAELRARENARIERGLVPNPIVEDPAIFIASSYLPGRRGGLLAGDFYDAVETADGSLHVMVGDVSGRGPDQAVLGAGLRIAWRALTLSGTRGELVLPTLQRVIEHERQAPGMFATLCTLEIAPDRRALTLRRAGHPPPMLIAAAGVSSLPPDRGGPPIGMFSDPEWLATSYPLPPEWALLLFTDGVIEVVLDGGPDRLGEDGLRRWVGDYVRERPRWRQDPHYLLSQLLASTREVSGEELHDDVAMVLFGPRETVTGGA